MVIKRISYTESEFATIFYEAEFEISELIKDGAWMDYIDEKGKKHKSVIQLHQFGDDDLPVLKKGQWIRIIIKTV